MRLAIPLALVLAAATSRDGCGNGDGAREPYEPCAGKACGASCSACPPSDRNCVAPAVVLACDPAGRCTLPVEGLCDAARAACAGKACGAECVVEPPCRTAVPPCMVPSELGHCDMGGSCFVGTPPPGFCLPPPPSWGCAGKRCGDSCGVCPEGTDPARCPVPTFAATACDAGLQCVTVGTFACPPPVEDCLGQACGTACASPCPPGAPCPMTPVAASCNGNQTCALPVPWDACHVPCAGKACGDTCALCPLDAKDCAETMELKACDASGRCVSRAGSFACRR